MIIESYFINESLNSINHGVWERFATKEDMAKYTEAKEKKQYALMLVNSQKNIYRKRYKLFNLEGHKKEVRLR